LERDIAVAATKTKKSVGRPFRYRQGDPKAKRMHGIIEYTIGVKLTIAQIS